MSGDDNAVNDEPLKQRKSSAGETKAAVTHAAAMAINDQQKTEREKKTARLKAMRLAQEGDKVEAVAPVEKKRGAKSKK
ncbi:hypothetical protein IFT84_09060 [Rhizobium sp. CFBP 8762]|uniref:hypothetical protein n=1 Tax=Rhizobium sp. CFBP 8762 TaxID=2775279 RepID=UPI00177F3573|nr:hypothetical protein [Rhizobium sp. CFBP 8762]MBD8554672.1 hypothetical protein [Rhizobium sp. CFBP 8762]